MKNKLTRKLQTLGELGPLARRQAISAVVVMGIVRMAQWFVPFASLRRMGENDRLRRVALPRYSAQDAAWVVWLASRYVPRANCLTRALTARVLLRASGVAHQLRIGVAKAPDFKAHAWIEHEGVTIIGGEESPEYAPILTFGEATGHLDATQTEIGRADLKTLS